MSLSKNSNAIINNDKISFEQKIQLKKDISKLSKQNCIIVLQYLMGENVNFTENSNGIFFNLKILTNEQIKELLNIVNNLKTEIKIDKKEEIIISTKEEDINNLHHTYEKYIQDDITF